MKALSCCCILFLWQTPLFAIHWELGSLGYELFFRQKEGEAPKVPFGWDSDLYERAGEFRNESYLNRRSGAVPYVGFLAKGEQNKFRYDLHLQFTNTTNILYAGKNHWLSYELGAFSIGVGRKEHLTQPKAFTTSFDGGEGVFWEWKANDKTHFQIFLYDRYQGFPLFSKEWARSVLLEPKTPRERYENDSTKGPNLWSQSSQNRRHSFQMEVGEFWKWQLGFHFVELGTKEKSAQEIPKAREKEGADGDHFWAGQLGFVFLGERFEWRSQIFWTKGMDRSNRGDLLVRGSLPIEGEAIELGFLWRGENFSFNLAQFLPDSEERTKDGILIKEGYIRSGTHPGQTLFLSQILNLIPAAAHTNLGYEREFSFTEGRFPGYFAETSLSYEWRSLSAKLVYAYLLPYKRTGAADGKISVQKERFEPFFFSEVQLELSLRAEEGFELGMGVTELILPENFRTKSQLGFFFLRVLL